MSMNYFPRLLRTLKNNELAGNFRQKGNAMFKVRKNREAVELYTRSIALAEDKSECLALAYANRSAVLFEKGFYEECLMNNYPENLKPKLLTRQEKAKILKPLQTSQNYFEPIPKFPEKNKNTFIDCAADSVEIKYSEDLGRHIVANRNIEIGEILAIEKPFCHILIKQHLNHCHQCMKLSYNLIPCKNCTQALYCSKKCRYNANFYHTYECQILTTMKSMKMDKLKLLPLKIALSVKDQYELIKNGCSTPDKDLYRSDRYQEIHNLVANTDSRSVSDLFDRSVTAAVVFHLIKKYTSFFDKPEDEVTFKELVLLHLQTAACNFHEISELAENKDQIFELDEIGAGAYSFLSMFNHSCSPNVVRHCYGPIIVLRALHSIKKGEQCYDNYGYHYALMTKSDRRAKLKKQYFFDCICEVCKNDWPLYQNLPEIKTDIVISDLDIVKLQNGEVNAANKFLVENLLKVTELEKLKPNKNLAELQEVIKQCFALLGNIRRTL
ncbi:hypothetical protein NQ314_012999 [Rhamnusium bicolor]|uniref:Protein-lysine N-methyltransferase SMYD4 n=1 Tax=Rhamnusium bicolor TaxID=1586634 RepID=A0AAV8X8F1_9CUCU|nr:hypothetical protein NQ314_012999 [Rhamnusium bicolor]